MTACLCTLCIYLATQLDRGRLRCAVSMSQGSCLQQLHCSHVHVLSSVTFNCLCVHWLVAHALVDGAVSVTGCVYAWTYFTVVVHRANPVHRSMKSGEAGVFPTQQQLLRALFFASPAVFAG
jgi:hypothetical protein